MPAVSKKSKEKLAANANKQSKPKEATNIQPQVISSQLQKQIENKKILKKKRYQKPRNRGVVFIKNLPHGFFEEQLKKYFEQFGRVTRVRLARSRRTGNSRGFAYVEFAVPEVGKIAAETMNNYLMFQKIVKTAYIPPEEQKFDYFKTHVHKVVNSDGKEVYVSRKTKHIENEVEKYNDWNDENYKKRTIATLKKLKKLKKKYPDIDFDNIIDGPKSIEDLKSSSDDKTFEDESTKNDSGSSEGDEDLGESNNENNDDMEDNDSTKSSESSSDESDSEKPGSILLIKKRKKTNKSTTRNDDEEATTSINNGDDSKLSKKYIRFKQFKLQKKKLKNENKENQHQKSLDESLSEGGLFDKASPKKFEKKTNSNEVEEKKDEYTELESKKNKKGKLLSGGIKKSKDKQLKSKKEKNKFNDKLKNKLVEETLKEMVSNNQNGIKKIKKSTGKKIKK